MAVSDIDKQRFKRDLDQAIAVANREIIHPLIPDVNRDSVLPLALFSSPGCGAGIYKPLSISPRKTTAMRRIRMKSMNCAIIAKCTKRGVSPSMHAIERGYVDLSE